MTDDRLPLAELLQKSGDGDFLRTVAENVLQIIMEADVDGFIGAGRHELSGERSTWRNGSRDRSLDTRLGTLNLKITTEGKREIVGLHIGPSEAEPFWSTFLRDRNGASASG